MERRTVRTYKVIIAGMQQECSRNQESGIRQELRIASECESRDS